MAEGGIGISDATKRPEYEALKKSYPTLVDCIERSVGTITDKLYSLEVFSRDEVKSLRNDRLSETEKARKILDVVISKVESEPSFIHEFIGILDQDGWMKPYTELLKENMEIEKSKLRCTSENTEDVESVEASSSDLDTTDSPPVMDIYTYLNDTESRLITKHQFDESDLEEETKEIQDEFASVVTNIARALRHNGITVKDIAFHLSELGSVITDNINVKSTENAWYYFSDEFVKQIVDESQGDIYKIFKALRRHYSWINWGFIKSIKQTFLRHNDYIQTLWDEYQTKFKQYCKERVCKIPRPINGTRTLSKRVQKSTPVIFKIDAKWHEIRFDRLKSIQKSIKKLLDLKSYTLHLSTVKQGCVELVFEVPQHVADVIFPPTKLQLQSLQEHSIRYCGLSITHTEMVEECISKPKYIEEDEGYYSKPSSEIGVPLFVNQSGSAKYTLPMILNNKFEDKNTEWKNIAIGEQNAEKYEIIIGLLGQKSISCPTSCEDSITDIIVNRVNVEELDLVKIGPHFSAEKVCEEATIPYFLPKKGYKKKIQNIARYCEPPPDWRKHVILELFTNNINSQAVELQQTRLNIKEVLLHAKIPTAEMTELQILPISKPIYRDIPGYKHWFSLLCCTVLKTSPYNFPRVLIEKMFAKRNYLKSQEDHPNKLYMQCINLEARKGFIEKEKIRKKIDIIIRDNAVPPRSTIGALIGALIINLPSFGVGAGAGLITGPAAIDGRKERRSHTASSGEDENRDSNE